MAEKVEDQTTEKENKKYYKIMIIFGWIAMMIFAFHASTHMVGAGDTWVAMACGRHFLNHGVDTVEQFSANSHEPGPTAEEVKKWPEAAQWITEKVGLDTVKKWHPTGWINQNWLTHVIFYWLSHESPFADAQKLSYNTLVYWKVALYIACIITVYYITRLIGTHAGLAALFSCFALFVGRSFFDIRPAGFSNLMVALYILILVLTTYRNYLYIWLMVPIAIFWGNLHGGYIYLFIMLVPFFGINLITMFLPDRFVSIGKKGLIHTFASGVVSFIAVVLFNPFHLTNLTHTFIISISKHAEKWRDINEWHPAFDWDNPVGDEIPFTIMLIIGVVVLIAALIASYVNKVRLNQFRKRKLKVEKEYSKPKIDLAIMAIALLTVYMAIRSRRFIPIAAFALCPLIAKLIYEIAKSISSSVNLRKLNKYIVTTPPRLLQQAMALFAVLACLFFGTWWGYKFYRVYLAEWPTDPVLNSVFMRMTASDAKPFYACEFIRQNELEGKIFNYWTEGGFIAYGQNPDPNTGKTPLQLFMDGRAQAAYDISAFDLWKYIMQGGPTYVKAVRRRHSLTSKDYFNIGKWISSQLRQFNVWVVLMPSNQFDKPIVKGLEHFPQWRLIFINNKQKMFVDIKSEQGRDLYEGIADGKTKFPNSFSKNLVYANALFNSKIKSHHEQGLDYALKALHEYPSQVPANMVLRASFNEDLRIRINKEMKEYLDDFVENEEKYRGQHAFFHRVAVAIKSANYLKNIAKRDNDSKAVEKYRKFYEKYRRIIQEVMENKRW